ncbi:type II secretion system F family protein [Allorhodopirellula solitaria]|uniref:Bacterial type II secretion system protein F domain protein n=1 Tax=Allorhodopirellula solitaria TaxID=2527987 RepID=A0A5C5XS10_9BACT|nr:type II secretion system F family protein [Allorhodopirellula solitaria]TWT64815.1 Bacterial type II secretion system protein F domain protein [Allorhodopirellula solitaria]
MNSLQAAPRSIDDESLAMLLDEVAAMADSGRSLTLGLTGLGDSAMGTIGRAAKGVRNRMEQGQSAAEAIASLSPTYHAPIRCAMQLMAQTGSTRPLNETVRMIRRSNQRRRQVRLATINPMLNIFVAATVLCLVIPWILLSLVQADLITTAFSPTFIDLLRTFTRHSIVAIATMLVVIGLFALFIVWGQRRSLQSDDAARDQAIFCRWLAMQMGQPGHESIESARAIETAAKVVSPAFAASWNEAVENIRAGAQSERAIAMPESLSQPVRQCVVDLVAAERDRQSIAVDLESLGELYETEAWNRQTWWIESIPKWLAGILMVAVITILIRTMVAPLLDVIGEVL